MRVIKAGLTFKNLEEVNEYYSWYKNGAKYHAIHFSSNKDNPNNSLNDINSFIFKNQRKPTSDELVKMFFGPTSKFTGLGI